MRLLDIFRTATPPLLLALSMGVMAEPGSSDIFPAVNAQPVVDCIVEKHFLGYLGCRGWHHGNRGVCFKGMDDSFNPSKFRFKVVEVKTEQPADSAVHLDESETVREYVVELDEKRNMYCIQDVEECSIWNDLCVGYYFSMKEKGDNRYHVWLQDSEWECGKEKSRANIRFERLGEFVFSTSNGQCNYHEVKTHRETGTVKGLFCNQKTCDRRNWEKPVPSGKR